MSDYVLVTRKFFPETIDFLKERFNVFDNQKEIILNITICLELLYQKN